ncbi:hypothetical protein M0813_22299 [Anaeramoeba flamelloides]|uniref:Transmembrane protein n=1 Tax=Anaeramoeba flamelloides TaxID=1746091 RepID=A0ABQ8YF21_9EUKA|nr:hypothetical protein M0813_22299 [Anaeramoeba flamelloides]
MKFSIKSPWSFLIFGWIYLLFSFVCLGNAFEIILQIIILSDKKQYGKEFKLPGAYICETLSDFFLFSSFAFIVFCLNKIQLHVKPFTIESADNQLKKYWMNCWIAIICFFFVLISIMLGIVDATTPRNKLILSGIYDLALSTFSLIVSVPSFILGIKLYSKIPETLDKYLMRLMKKLFYVILFDLIIYVILALFGCYFFSIKFIQNKDVIPFFGSTMSPWPYFIVTILEVLPTFAIVLLLGSLQKNKRTTIDPNSPLLAETSNKAIKKQGIIDGSHKNAQNQK